MSELEQMQAARLRAEAMLEVKAQQYQEFTNRQAQVIASIRALAVSGDWMLSARVLRLIDGPER